MTVMKFVKLCVNFRSAVLWAISFVTICIFSLLPFKAYAAEGSVLSPERAVLAADAFGPWTDGNRAKSRLPKVVDVTESSGDVVSHLRSEDGGAPFGALPMENGWRRYEGKLGDAYIVVTAGAKPAEADAPYPYPMVRETLVIVPFENEELRAAYRLQFMKLWGEVTTFPPNPAEMEPGFERVQVYTNRQVRYADARIMDENGSERPAFVYAMRRC